eukprot:319001-Lingulodinium_polyedra.AAC.1
MDIQLRTRGAGADVNASVGAEPQELSNIPGVHGESMGNQGRGNRHNIQNQGGIHGESLGNRFPEPRP